MPMPMHPLLALASMLLVAPAHAEAPPVRTLVVLAADHCDIGPLASRAAGGDVTPLVGSEPAPPSVVARRARAASADRVLTVDVTTRAVAGTTGGATHLAEGTAKMILSDPDTGAALWTATVGPVLDGALDPDRALQAACRATAEQVARRVLDRRAQAGEPVDSSAFPGVAEAERRITASDALLSQRLDLVRAGDDDGVADLEAKADALLFAAFLADGASPYRLFDALHQSTGWRVVSTADGQRWFVARREETGGTAAFIEGVHLRWTAAGRPAFDGEPTLSSSLNIVRFETVAVNGRSMDLPIIRHQTCSTCVLTAIDVRDEGKSGAPTDGAGPFDGFMFESRDLESDIERVAVPHGGAKGGERPVALFDYRFRQNNEDDVVTQVADCRPYTPGPEDWNFDCQTTGRLLFDGAAIWQIERNGRCLDEAPGWMQRYCGTTSKR